MTPVDPRLVVSHEGREIEETKGTLKREHTSELTLFLFRGRFLHLTRSRRERDESEAGRPFRKDSFIVNFLKLVQLLSFFSEGPTSLSSSLRDSVLTQTAQVPWVSYPTCHLHCHLSLASTRPWSRTFEPPITFPKPQIRIRRSPDLRLPVTP